MASIVKAAAIIDSFPEKVQLAGAVPFEEVWVAEGHLDVTFPDSYREFLQRYGAGSIGDREVYGLGVPTTG
ncbi:MAG TPA: SMI1/KNR4 family protein, partial [Chloroflexia bacterium]|nr:SMI1/KNR4 family protein [Chloroflexia bacterium]